jgi:hypothetical protein
MNPVENDTRTMPNTMRLRVAREFINRFLRPTLLLALLLALVCGPRNLAQRGGGGTGGNGNSGPPTRPSMDQDPLSQGLTTPGDPNDTIARERRMKAMNAERQKSMVADSNKLLKLTTELNEEVNGAHPRPLNSDQLRTVAEIEKLAKNIRDKMSNPVGEPQVFSPPISLPMPGMQ